TIFKKLRFSNTSLLVRIVICNFLSKLFSLSLINLNFFSFIFAQISLSIVSFITIRISKSFACSSEITDEPKIQTNNGLQFSLLNQFSIQIFNLLIWLMVEFLYQF